MKILGMFVAIVVLLVSSPSMAQTLSRSEAKRLRMAPEVERSFVLKTAENGLFEKANRMFTDPENKKDGYQWALKMIASYYFILAKDAAELHLNELAGVYLVRASMFGQKIRGEISLDEIEREERRTEDYKKTYLEELMRTASNKPHISLRELQSMAKYMVTHIHAESIASATSQ